MMPIAVQTTGSEAFDMAQLRAAIRDQRKATIAYVMTTQGPEPVEYRQSPLDYEHYIDKQLRPVADAVLPFIGCHFAQWGDEQMSLF